MPASLGLPHVSLRFRLIILIAIALVLSLGVEGLIVFANASRSVRTEMDSALQVGRQTIRNAILRLEGHSDPRAELESLVASFQGNRHLRVSLPGDPGATARPVAERSSFGSVPSWIIRLLGVPRASALLPVVVDGREYGDILIETDPANEILEVWNGLGDSLMVLGLLFGLELLFIPPLIGRALRPLDTLAAALNQIGHGDYRARLSGNTARELSGLRHSFNRMAEELAAMERDKSRLNEMLLTLQEEERNGIARDLHDDVSPFLFAIRVDLAAVNRLAGRGETDAIPAQIASISQSVGQLQTRIRTMLERLRPGVLADFGLAEAVTEMVEFWRRRHPEIEWRVQLPPAETTFGPLVDTTIYRIVQEGLANALRHAGARTIAVSIGPAPFPGPLPGSVPGAVQVVVADDGEGLGTASGPGFGLLGMRERIRAMGGTLMLTDREEGGLRIAALLPGPSPARTTSPVTEQP